MKRKMALAFIVVIIFLNGINIYAQNPTADFDKIIHLVFFREGNKLLNARTLNTMPDSLRIKVSSKNCCCDIDSVKLSLLDGANAQDLGIGSGGKVKVNKPSTTRTPDAKLLAEVKVRCSGQLAVYSGKELYYFFPVKK